MLYISVAVKKLKQGFAFGVGAMMQLIFSFNPQVQQELIEYNRRVLLDSEGDTARILVVHELDDPALGSNVGGWLSGVTTIAGRD